ncbi:MAG: PAS domain-containing protein [Methylobacterium mesophilicum]|nr:PAS domain-containing protein [Methylobacterium mesophilicum]
MARSIREFDWSETALGAIRSWPQSLRTAVDLTLGSPVATILLWGEDLIQIYNDHWRALMGSKHPTALGQPTHQCFPEIVETMAPLYERVHQGEAVVLQNRLLPVGRFSSGVADAWWNVHYLPTRDGDGVVVGILCTVIETTASVLAEQEKAAAVAALRVSEARFRALTHIGTYAVYRMNADWSEMTALEGQGFLADMADPDISWLDQYIMPQDQSAVLEAIDTAVRSHRVFELEHRVRLADGGVGWTHSRAVPLFDEDGKLHEWIGSASDITARKQHETTLHQSEERQAFLLRLSDALRPIGNASDAQAEALRVLEEYLAVDRANYFETDEDGRLMDRGDQPANGVLFLVERFGRTAFDPERDDANERAAPFIVSDTADLPLGDRERDVLATSNVRSAVCIPIIKSGTLVAALAVSHGTPRPWSPADVAIVEETAERIWAEAKRARAEAKLNDSEKRFRLFAENSTDVLWIVNAQSRQLEYVSPSFESIWGERRAQVVADFSRWLEMVIPEDRTKAERVLQSALNGERIIQSYRIRRPSDGAERWLQDTSFPIRDEAGRIVRVGGVTQDLTDRTRAELEIRARRRELRTLVENIPQLVWRAVDSGHWVWASSQWCEFTGQEEKESHGWGWLKPVHPDDREAARQAWQAAGAQGYFETKYRVHGRNKGYRWFQTRATPLYSEDGELVEWFGTSTDIDDIRRLQNHERVLLAELQHRVRNTLAVIRSIVRRTAATSPTLDDYTMHLEGRIDSFARVQASVTRDPSRGVDLEYLVGEELRAIGARENENATVKGPKVMMSPAAAETVALAIHELATNAMKYGAMTAPRGEIRVRWSLEDESGVPTLLFRWVEQGMQRLEQPSHRGFGTMILTRTVAYELKANAELDFTPTGLTYHLSAPLDRLLMSQSEGLVERDA